MKIKILSESTYDFKYRSIFSNISNIEIEEGGFIKLLKSLAKGNKYYHIRYIKYRGILFTFLRLLIIYLTAKFFHSKIIWSCHNIYEHNIPSKRYNDFIRVFLSFIADYIIVFHKDLVKFLPKKNRDKIIIASFGNFKNFIKNQKKENNDFLESYQYWLNKNNIKSPDIISISTAKRNNLELLIKNHIDKNILVIAPYIKKISNIKNSSKLLYYNNGFVKKEIHEILNTNHKIIGYVGHDNISVPTSLYMYASYGIPVIVLNNKPVNTIIKEYKIGEVLNDTHDLSKIFDLIQNNYSYYSNNCKIFLEENSWKKSSVEHSKIFTNRITNENK